MITTNNLKRTEVVGDAEITYNFQFLFSCSFIME